MNIFYLDHDTKVCASQHNDKHVVKMILEYAQLLSTAHHVCDERVRWHDGFGNGFHTHLRENIYKKTHVNHPSAVWARANVENYFWLYTLWLDLLDEYTHRYGKVHASARLRKWLSCAPAHIPDGKFYEPTQAMPDEFKSSSSIEAYRKYYASAKKHLAKWTKRNMPVWYFALCR
jgi:hypothetical protein